MITAKLYNQTGQENGVVELNGEVFGRSKLNKELVHEVAVAMLAGRRNTVASTKTRGEVRGGGKKPWQQKGTGRARAGSIRSPLWRGGGITFGPRSNRNFGKKVNKKTKRASVLMVLSDRARDGRVSVLENLELAEGKTRELATVMKALGDKIENFGKNILLVLPKSDAKIWRASRNLPSMRAARADQLNLLELLTADRIVVYKEALPVLEKAMLKQKAKI